MSKKYLLDRVSDNVALKIEEFLNNTADPNKNQYVSSSVINGNSLDIDIFETGYKAEEISMDNYAGREGEIHHIKVNGSVPIDSYYIPKD